MSNELLVHNAEEKLKKESADITERKAAAMLEAVRKALISFCKQEPEFAQAIIESKGTFKECMTAVTKGIGDSISDLEAYKRAVQFYFPGADIQFNMTVDLCASAKEEKPESMNVSLFDLL